MGPFPRSLDCSRNWLGSFWVSIHVETTALLVLSYVLFLSSRIPLTVDYPFCHDDWSDFLAFNQLTSSIPTELGLMTLLTELNLGKYYTRNDGIVCLVVCLVAFVKDSSKRRLSFLSWRLIWFCRCQSAYRFHPNRAWNDDAIEWAVFV